MYNITLSCRPVPMDQCRGHVSARTDDVWLAHGDRDQCTTPAARRREAAYSVRHVLLPLLALHSQRGISAALSPSLSFLSVQPCDGRMAISSKYDSDSPATYHNAGHHPRCSRCLPLSTSSSRRVGRSLSTQSARRTTSSTCPGRRMEHSLVGYTISNPHAPFPLNFPPSSFPNPCSDSWMLTDGNFWGVLKITHDFDKDNHSIDFSGTRLTKDMPKDFFLDQRTISKLLIATKPTTARCSLTIRSPGMQYVDLNISLANMWTWGVTYPQAENVGEGRVKVCSFIGSGGPARSCC